jgi:WhiB family redox-sensing transcriptional regulator
MTRANTRPSHVGTNPGDPDPADDAAAAPIDDETEVAWQAEALCAQVDPELFFARGRHRTARRICASCPVVGDCLAYALALPTDPAGIWGGTTQPERSRLRRRARDGNDADPSPRPACRRASRDTDNGNAQAVDTQAVDAAGSSTQGPQRLEDRTSMLIPWRQDVDKLLLTPEEAAQMLNVSRSKIYLLLRNGDLESVRVGGSRRIPTAALTDYVSELRTRAAV